MSKRIIGTSLVIERSALLLGTIWIAVLAVSLAWNWRQVGDSMMVLAESEAYSSFNKDLVYRHWASLHGGVYVPTTEATPPNPYLAHLPHRDVTTASGKQLTLINPAYMTRQVHELGKQQYGLLGHITSLNPIRPENIADTWETETLLAFQDGVEQATSVEIMGDSAYFRLMRPLVAQKRCMTCHTNQGYAVGDVIGGISVSVPLLAYMKQVKSQRTALASVHALLGFFGLIGIGTGHRLLRKTGMKLRASEQHLSATLRSIGDGVIACDCAGRVTSLNGVAETLTGWSTAEVAGRPLEEVFRIIHAQTRETADDPVARALKEGVNVELANHTTLIARDGTEHQIADSCAPIRDAAGVVVGAVLVFRDVTEEYRRREELRESYARYDQVVSNINDVIWRYEVDARGQFAGSYISPVADRLLGLAPGTIGDSFDKYFSYAHADDLPTVKEVLAKGLKTTGQDITAEYRLCRPDGVTVWVRSNGSAYAQPDGGVVAFGTTSDITEWKWAQECREISHARRQGINLLQQSLLEPAPLEDKLRKVTAGIVRLFDADFCRVWLIRPGDLCQRECIHAAVEDGPHVCHHRDFCLHLVASSGRYTHIDGPTHRRVPYDCYKIGRIASGEDHKFLTNDAQNDPRVHNHQWASELGLVSFAGYQLRVPGGDTIGVLALFAQHPIDESDDAMLDGLSAAVALVVQQAAAQESLLASEEKHRLLIEHAISGIAVHEIILDATGKPVDYVFVDANPAFETHTGLRVADILGRRVTEVLPGTEKTPFIDIYGKVVLTGEPISFEQFSEPVGRHYAINAYKIAEGRFATVFADITERKQAAARLAEQTRLLQTVLDGIPDVIALQDIDHSIISYNKAGYEIIGLPPGEVHGRKCFELLGRTSPCAACATSDAVAAKQAVSRERYVPEIQRWIRATSIPILDDAGRTTMVVEQLQDITEQEQARRELKQTVEALVSANKTLAEFSEATQAATRAKSEFLANMSHEIRTPMTAILGFAEVLLGEPGFDQAPPERVEAIEAIQRNGKYLLQLINDILDLSKIEAGKLDIERTTCSPTQVLAEVMSLMRVRAAAKGIPLKLEYDGGIPEVIQCDPLRLRQILINLVGNAIKFTETGSVRMVARLLRPAAKPALLQIDVVDTGIGLTAEQASRLFRPFSQADSSTTRKFGGTGLGLTISKRIAEMLGGDITLCSEPGKGSTFSVIIEAGELEGIRLLEKPTEAVTPVPAPSNAAPNVRLDGRILLAEDGPDNQRLIAFVLKKAGAEVTVAENGQIALDQALAARERGEPFDLILMDMQMPVMDGYEATRRLRAAGYSGPVFALTAHAMAGDDARCRDAGCNGYLTKPIDRAVFLPAIAERLKSNATYLTLPRGWSDAVAAGEGNAQSDA